MNLYLLKYSYRKVLLPLAERLDRVDPDLVSYAAVAAAMVTGIFFYQASSAPWLLLGAIALTLLRMTLNTLDGLMAIRQGNLSLRGEIVNALPDRYSDLFVVGGIALSPLCHTWLGVAGLCSMVLVSYTGMLGKALGVSWQHQGPLGKVERLILLMIFAVLQYAALRQGATPRWFGIEATPLEWAMILFVVLGQVTVVRRLRGQVRQIDRKEALERLDPTRNQGRAIVIYDSMTGNTQLVAEQIAAGLGCGTCRVSEAAGIGEYSLVVLGSPNLRKEATAKMKQFQARTADRPRMLAVFATYGAPIWGQISVPFCLRSMGEAWGLRPVARFACKGLHPKYKTYKGRPNDEDKLGAFLFGLKLSRLLEKDAEREKNEPS
jgi:archaetidylinositol phosphate synthase